MRTRVLLQMASVPQVWQKRRKQTDMFWLEIFRLMFKSKGADEAISSVICDRDAFRSLLVCVPRVVKQREVDVVKRKRKGGATELRPNKSSKESEDGSQAAKKVCFNFRKEGTCKFGAMCKFAHLKKE